MGGRGERFSEECAAPKQFHKLAGKPIYLHTLQAFLAHSQISEIILVCPFEWMEKIHQEIAPYKEQKMIHVVRGGSSRQSSSWQGLLACGPSTDYVLIHDAVRPFVTEDIIQRNIDAVVKHEAVNTCIPTYDTINIVHNQLATEIPKRDQFMRGQTPQTFAYKTIFDAHLAAQDRNAFDATDDCLLVLKQGIQPFIVSGHEDNMKITTELDLFLAEQLHYRKKSRKETRLPTSSLKNKTFVVTGATGGIGRAICTLLQKHGAHIIPVSRSSKAWKCDLTNAKEVADIFQGISVKHGPIHGLINAAGQLHVSPLKDLSASLIQEQIDSNLTGIIYACKYANIIEGGHIINIASSSYSRGRKEYTVYSAAKAGLVNFTQGLADEKEELFINVVIPQRTNTSMRQNNFPAEDLDDLLSPRQVAEEVCNLLLTSKLTGGMVPITKKPENKAPRDIANVEPVC